MESSKTITVTLVNRKLTTDSTERVIIYRDNNDSITNWTLNYRDSDNCSSERRPTWI